MGYAAFRQDRQSLRFWRKHVMRTAESHDFRGVLCENDLSPPEKENDSRTIPEVILSVVRTVGKVCPEVFNLNRTNREVVGDFEINAPACGHRESVLGRGVDAPGSPEQHLCERSHPLVPAKINPRSELVGDNSCMETGAG
jgi:hypothetical protein